MTPESAPAPDAAPLHELRELAAIHRSLRALLSTLELPEILRSVLDSIKTFTASEALSFMLYDPERDELVFAASEMLRESALVGAPPGDEVARWVAQCGESVLAEDATVLAVPLCRAGRSIGAIELRTRYDGSRFDDADRARLEALAATLAAEVDPERLPHDAEALRRVFARLAATVPSQVASLLLHDLQGRPLSFSASRAIESGPIDGVRMRTDEGIAGWVARHREPVLLDDASDDPRHYRVIAERTGLRPRSMLCVPVVKKDVLLGVIQVINKLDGGSFTKDELRLVTTLADHAAIAIENARLYREARVAAITDDLTGLYNTRHFNAALPALLAKGGPVSLLVLDLDAFKAVVDRHGHLVGSQTIAFVGRLVARAMRPGDVAARFGGDEFVLILPGADTVTAQRIAETIRASVAEAHVLDGTGVDISGVTASIGVATFPEHATDPTTLFLAADAAMYAVKKGAKNAIGTASGRWVPPSGGPRTPRSPSP